MNESIVKIMEVIVMKYEDMSLNELSELIDNPDFDSRSEEEQLQILQEAVHKKNIELRNKGLLRPIWEVYDPSKYEDEDDE